jgi:hypothetical protein
MIISYDYLMLCLLLTCCLCRGIMVIMYGLVDILGSYDMKVIVLFEFVSCLDQYWYIRNYVLNYHHYQTYG